MDVEKDNGSVIDLYIIPFFLVNVQSIWAGCVT